MGIVENAKDIADLIRKAGDTDLYRKINALEGEIIDLTREKRQAEQRVEELQGKLRFKEQFEFKPPFVFIPGDLTPYCAACWEAKQAPVHLVFQWTQYGESRWNCPIYKHEYDVPAGVYGTRAHPNS